MFLSEQRKWPSPPTNPENETFFKAASEGRLLIGRCQECENFHYYPRRSCPHCFSDAIEWVEASGRGKIYSFSVAAKESDQQVLAFIDLEEGVQMLSNIIDTAPEKIFIGANVRVVFGNAGDYKVPLFQLENGGEIK